MTLELKIAWDGDAPGLREHRLSIAAFGPALQALLGSMRRIASGLLRDVQDPAYGAKGGKYAQEAEFLDLEIGAVREGSMGLDTTITVHVPIGKNYPLGLEAWTTERLLEAIDAESHGIERNVSVRKYLRALPAGVTSQSYALYENTRLLRHVSVGDVKLLDEPRALPYTDELVGDVAGVDFEPSKPSVRLLVEGHFYSCLATAEQVDRALDLRGDQVRAMVLFAPKPKLIWIYPATPAKAAVDAETRNRFLFHRWEAVLRRLAQ